MDQQQINNELMGEDNSGGGGGAEPDFPHAKLALLDDKISSPRWVVPVLPEQELEVLLQASIDLCRKGELQLSCISREEAYELVKSLQTFIILGKVVWLSGSAKLSLFLDRNYSFTHSVIH